MAEITSAGYQSLRDFVQANWKYIELQNASGTAVLRIGIGDARVTWTHTAGAQTLQLQVVVKGTDTGIVAGTTVIGRSAIFSVATGGSALSVETISPFTFEQTGDELTVIHQLQVPQVV